MTHTLEFANRRELANRSIRSQYYRQPNGRSIGKSFNSFFFLKIIFLANYRRYSCNYAAFLE